MERSPRRDHHNLGPPVCKSADVAFGRIRRNAGQAVAEQISPAHRRVDDRRLWRPPAQIQWPGEMAVSLVHRESSCHAPDRAPPPRWWLITIHVVRQHLGRTRRHLPHRSGHPVLRRDRGCWNIIIRVPISNTSIDRSPISQRQWDSPEIVGKVVSVQRYLTHVHHSEEHPEIGGEVVSAQHRLAHVRHLDGRTEGAHFGIIQRLRNHVTPIALGNFAVLHHVWDSQYV